MTLLLRRRGLLLAGMGVLTAGEWLLRYRRRTRR
jgi:hypothetical protein